MSDGSHVAGTPAGNKVEQQTAKDRLRLYDCPIGPSLGDRIDCALTRLMAVPAAAEAIARGAVGCIDFDTARTRYLLTLASTATLAQIVAAFH